MALAVGVHVYGDGLCHTDGVAQLYEHFVGHSGCHHVLCNVACGVGCRAVHLRGVFAGESSAAVGAFSAVGVNDDFAAGQSGVAVGATDDKLAGGVYEILDGAFLEEGFHLGGVNALADDARYEDAHHIVADLVEHELVGLFL